MQPVDKKAFGLRVAQRRNALGLSQGALADAVGMKQQGVDNIEHGVVGRPRLLKEIAAALYTTQEWLLWKTGPEIAPPRQPELIQVPLVTWVSAGHLANTESQIPVEEVPLLTFTDLGRGEFFALRVEGDSMDRLSPDGSVIIVNRAERMLVTGKSYVFSIQGDTTFKLWHSDPPYLAPYSTNPIHKPVFIRRKRDFEVIGRVRRTVLDL